MNTTDNMNWSERKSGFKGHTIRVKEIYDFTASVKLQPTVTGDQLHISLYYCSVCLERWCKSMTNHSQDIQPWSFKGGLWDHRAVSVSLNFNCGTTWTVCTKLCINTIFFSFLILGNDSMEDAWACEVGMTLNSM